MNGMIRIKMAEDLNFHISLFLVSTSFLNLVSCYCPATDRSLFVFGDSYFDTGNNNYFGTDARANFDGAYGDTFFKYPNGRFSDGRLISDFIASYMNLPYPAPYLQGNIDTLLTYGINFASAGAGALAETHRDLLHPKDLRTQLSYFEDVANQLKQKLGDAQSKEVLSKAICLFNIGSNDYLVPFYSNSTLLQSYSKKLYVAMVIGNMTDVVKEIYKTGGRKFVFINVGPLGCMPYTIAMYPKSNGSCVEEATKLAKMHNKALSLTLIKLQKKLVGLRFGIHNLFGSLSERMNNPSNYGFKQAKSTCCVGRENRSILTCGGMGGFNDYELCQNPTDYVFFDLLHLTEKVYQQISEQIWNGPRNVTMPHNLKTLLG